VRRAVVGERMGVRSGAVGDIGEGVVGLLLGLTACRLSNYAETARSAAAAGEAAGDKTAAGEERDSMA